MDSIWPVGAVNGGAVSRVANQMQLSIAAGQAAVPLQSGQHAALVFWDSAEIAQFSPAPATGMSRIDIVVATVRDNAIDAGGNNDFIFQVIAGVPAASNPVQPATPANSLLFFVVTVTSGLVDLTTALVVDVRRLGLQMPGQTQAYDMATDLILTATAATTVFSGTFTPSRTCVRVELCCTGYNAVANSRVYFRANVGALVSRLCSPMSAVAPQAIYCGGAAIFTGFTPGNLSTFSIQGWVDAGNTFRVRSLSQPSLESLRMIISDA